MALDEGPSHTWLRMESIEASPVDSDDLSSWSTLCTVSAYRWLHLGLHETNDHPSAPVSDQLRI